VTYTVRKLAELVAGDVVGDDNVVIEDALPLSTASTGHISFLENGKHTKEVGQCKASALLVPAALAALPCPAIVVDDPLGAFLTIFKAFHRVPEPPGPGIDPRAYVHPSARLGDGVSLQPFVTIGENAVLGDRSRLYPGVVVGRNCVLGSDVVLFPNVVVYDGCRLGNRVIIHANAVIGADGFGYRQHGGRHIKIPQLGGVEIADDVEIGACSTVDGGTFQATRIGEGTKIDNLVQIAHNCQIGRHNLFVSQAGVAGSCVTGDYVVVAGQAGIADHLHLGDGAMIGAQAGVIADVPPGQRLLGTPARPEREAKLVAINAERVGELRKDVRRIKQHLGLNGEHE
jgi:UDP-3-O-[3-hydroxymyristoyl] glucosamine N-acyltransferase